MYIDGNNRLINEIDKEIDLLAEMRIIGSKNGLDIGWVSWGGPGAGMGGPRGAGSAGEARGCCFPTVLHFPQRS